MPEQKATDRDILDAIRSTMRHRGYPPSVRELAAVVGLSPTQTSTRLRDLENTGAIRRTMRNNVTVGIEIMGDDE